jgi:ornithine racemase
VNRVTLNVDALRHNLETVSGWVRGHGASLTVVTKALCGNEQAVRSVLDLGVRSIADSRLSNLRRLPPDRGPLETWYLRPPHPSGLAEVVELADVSLNSELQVIRQLEAEAARQQRTHRVVIMIELGDLREGILPGSLAKVYEEIFTLPHIEVLGIGANLGCLSGAVPTVDELMQLALYRELLELKFSRSLPLISAGTSAVLPLLLEGHLPHAVNHFRVGESILLGTDPLTQERLRGLRDDVVTVEAEVVELKEKRLVAPGETTENTPFTMAETDDDFAPGQRGYRALVTLGQVDTEVAGLRPVNPRHSIAGASSDITVVNVGDAPDGIAVGDVIAFRPGYGAFVRLMNNPDTETVIQPLRADLDARGRRPEAEVLVPPVAVAAEAPEEAGETVS